MSFKDYILNVHPDPDFLGSKTVYDAYDELDRLAQNYAKDQNERLTKELNDLGVKFDKELERWQERDSVEIFRRKQLEMDCANQAAELTRLRELVTQYLDNSTSDNAYGADVRDRILNELNPKP